MTPRPPTPTHGDVVILIEDGFVDRPEPNSLLFWYQKNDLDDIDSDDYDRRSAAVTRMGARRYDQRDWAADRYRASRCAGRRWIPRSTCTTPLRSTRRTRGDGCHGSRRAVAPCRFGASVASGGTITMNVSDAVRADFDRGQPARLARASRVRWCATRRSTAQAAFETAGEIATSDDESKKDKKPDNLPEKNKKGENDSADDGGDGKGWKIAGAVIVGLAMLFVHAGSQVLDQPDLRAWQLLPDRVTVARMRLPVGEYPIEVTRDGEAFSLGTVTVRPGSVTVLTHRWWPDDRRIAGR